MRLLHLLVLALLPSVAVAGDSYAVALVVPVVVGLCAFFVVCVVVCVCLCRHQVLVSFRVAVDRSRATQMYVCVCVCDLKREKQEAAEQS